MPFGPQQIEKWDVSMGIISGIQVFNPKNGTQVLSQVFRYWVSMGIISGIQVFNPKTAFVNSPFSKKKSIFSQENRLFSCQRIFCQIEDRGSQCHESERRDETRSMVSMVAGAADVTVTEHCLKNQRLASMIFEQLIVQS